MNLCLVLNECAGGCGCCRHGAILFATGFIGPRPTVTIVMFEDEHQLVQLGILRCRISTAEKCDSFRLHFCLFRSAFEMLMLTHASLFVSILTAFWFLWFIPYNADPHPAQPRLILQHKPPTSTKRYKQQFIETFPRSFNGRIPPFYSRRFTWASRS